MNKDIPITLIGFNEVGEIAEYSKKKKNKEYAPIISRNDDGWVFSWWEDRAIPSKRNHLDKMLRSKGFNIPKEYLFKNLGLSLTDCYWINPMDSGLKWNDVNLFTNQFKDSSLQWEKDDETGDVHMMYSPNGSLKGNIEKTWAIKGHERYIIKGNRNEKSYESINEVIACMIHKSQGFDNYTDYNLLKIPDKRYDYGCISKMFTSEKTELISAYEMILSEKKNLSYYEHLLHVCENNNMDKNRVREELEYQILTDYVMSQTDRHFGNIGFLRNSDSLDFIGVAPIYDNGGSMYYDSDPPTSVKEAEYLATRGFEQYADHMLKLVQNPDIIKLDKLPPASAIEELYNKDSKANKEHIKNVCHIYEYKIEVCRNYQLGKPLHIPSYNISARKPLPTKSVEG